MGRRPFRRMWYAASALVLLPSIGAGYALAYGSLFGAEVELFLPAPGTVSTAVRARATTHPAVVTSGAARLFYEDGKGPRADRFAVSSSKPAKPSITASLTGMPNFLKAVGNGEVKSRNRASLLLSERRSPESALFQTSGDASPFNADFQVDAFRPDPDQIAYRPSDEALSFRYQGETQAEFEERERRCLATAIYFEARGEPLKGQIAVSQVILNRVRSPKFPQTICGVVYQGQYRKGCQFSFTCDGRSDNPRDKGQWAHSQDLARSFMEGEHWLSEVGYSTFYHANYVRPRWASSMNRIDKIGRHIFYKKRGEAPYTVEAALDGGTDSAEDATDEDTGYLLPTMSLASAVQAVTNSVSAVTQPNASASTQMMSLGYGASE
ncbi:MAG: cell wall hydrolase [Pseudomonadota bacterium]